VGASAAPETPAGQGRLASLQARRCAHPATSRLAEISRPPQGRATTAVIAGQLLASLCGALVLISPALVWQQGIDDRGPYRSLGWSVIGSWLAGVIEVAGTLLILQGLALWSRQPRRVVQVAAPAGVAALLLGLLLLWSILASDGVLGPNRASSGPGIVACAAASLLGAGACFWVVIAHRRADHRRPRHRSRRLPPTR